MTTDEYLKIKKLWLIYLDIFCYKAKIFTGLPHGNGGYHIPQIEVKAVLLLATKYVPHHSPNNRIIPFPSGFMRSKV